MKKILIVAAMALALAGCTDKEGATRAIVDAGLKPVNVGGYSFFGCDSHDNFSTRFMAKNANGLIVTGVVCGGWFKNNTVRFD